VDLRGAEPKGAGPKVAELRGAGLMRKTWILPSGSSSNNSSPDRRKTLRKNRTNCSVPLSQSLMRKFLIQEAFSYFVEMMLGCCLHSYTGFLLEVHFEV
jgi:hypothetical protein